jgi:DNA-binding MarR family transcriptional regulator
MRLNLKRLGLLAGKAARMFAARARLTPQRIDLMLQLRQWRLNQKDLADRLCVTRPVVSRMLKALVALGLVETTIGERDRRERYPQLTRSGKERLAKCFPGDTRHGAQDHGEITWLHRWREIIADQLGIRVDSILRSRVPTLFANFAAKHECVPDWLWRPWQCAQPY